MTRLILIALTAAAVAGSAQAQGRMTCQDMGFGTQNCRDSDGKTYTSHTDAFGNTMVRDSAGATTNIHRDAYGNTTAFGPDGSIVQGRTDAFGTTTYRDQRGNQTHCRQLVPLPGLPGQSVQDCQ